MGQLTGMMPTSSSSGMAAKTDTLEQHMWLHQQWPPPYCCLCNYEARIKELEEKIKELEERKDEGL